MIEPQEPRKKIVSNLKNLFKQNRILFILSAALLVLVNIFLLIQIKTIFSPLSIIIDIVAIPTIFAALFYYLFKPVRDWLESKGVQRFAAVIIIFLLIITILAIIIFSILPFMQEQITMFVKDFPKNWELFVNAVDQFLQNYELEYLRVEINEFFTSLTATVISNIENYLSQITTIIGSAIGSVFSIAIGVITAPILLYYMLKEGDKLKGSIVQLFPIKTRTTLNSFLSDANRQLALYIRGQILVAIGVAIMFAIGYSIIRLPYGMVLALISGILNVIPYLGTFMAMVPAFIIALIHSPIMFVYVFIVFTIEQTIEGRILSPKILGTNLDIHPVTILIVLLASGRLFGFAGIIIGVPLYAIAKVAVKYLYNYLKLHTDLY